MSDTFYRTRAARRARTLGLIGAVVLVVACIFFTISVLFYDTCSNSFDRTPRAVVLSFIEGVKRGDQATVVQCWVHDAYYDLEAGCSEVCLSRILGIPYQVVEVTLGEPYPTEEGRLNVTATVTVACPDGEEQYTGQILLDAVGTNVPWRHWKIVQSTFGGPLSAPWCK